MLRTRHSLNSDVCGRCLNPTERRTRQNDSVITDPLKYIYVYSLRSNFLGLLKLSSWCIYVYIRKYLDINIYIYVYFTE